MGLFSLKTLHHFVTKTYVYLLVVKKGYVALIYSITVFQFLTSLLEKVSSDYCGDASWQFFLIACINLMLTQLYFLGPKYYYSFFCPHTDAAQGITVHVVQW